MSMEKWTINGRSYFAAPVDTPEIRQWLTDIESKPVYELINNLCYDWREDTVNLNSLKFSVDAARLADWKRARVIDEIERRINEKGR